ncbi:MULTISPECIES: DUF4407 domain-containing protein [unclassified Micromonospora]|uniref:DUF4407 domain-containing protein n=1 Tax=unclassified Micromonospora TaxID=2617518 RepID=UPI00103391E7|nr:MULTISPECIES: DUF4407 domain-containing protein [unclassified Micromonospora]QKW14004.1 DUF4407 domain-containing protein [Verrucosispora sp. NA02020]TBL39528.1 DUF4407 domain-containing protein [Verrucosispora sp. SN26_14.1]
MVTRWRNRWRRGRFGPDSADALRTATSAAPPPTGATPPGRAAGRNPFTRLFLWCAGVDRTLVETRSERYRYVGIGVFIVLIATLSAVMFALFGSVIRGGFTVALIPFAVGWGVLIFWADRSIMAEPNYGDLRHVDAGSGTRRAGWWSHGRQVSQYGFRVVIAIGAAFLVTEAVLLLLFQSEIRRELDRSHTDQVAVAQRVDSRGETAEIAALRSEKRANDDRVTAAEQAVTEAADALAGEADGSSGSGRPGFGQVAAQRETELRRLRKVARQTRDEVATANAVLDERIEKLQSDRQSRIDASVAAITGDRGWITQERALHRFLQANRDNLLVLAIPWVLRVTLLAIDLLPVSLKLLAPPTLYDRRVRAQAELSAYRTRRWLEAGRDSVDQLADLDQVRANTLYDLAREEENYRKSTRLGHLRNGG